MTNLKGGRLPGRQLSSPTSPARAPSRPVRRGLRVEPLPDEVTRERDGRRVDATPIVVTLRAAKPLTGRGRGTTFALWLQGSEVGRSAACQEPPAQHRSVELLCAPTQPSACAFHAKQEAEPTTSKRTDDHCLEPGTPSGPLVTGRTSRDPLRLAMRKTPSHGCEPWLEAGSVVLRRRASLLAARSLRLSGALGEELRRAA